MSRAHYYYFPHSVLELEKKIKSHQEDFENLLNDTFTEEELLNFEKFLDELAAVFVQPIFSEMSFDDFYSNQAEEERQKFFFESCKSSLCVENLPDFHSNPFQVTYLIELLREFDDVLVDRGGVEELQFKKEYVSDLKRFKNIFSLLKDEPVKKVEIKTSAPVDPIDFLILDVRKELNRLDLQEVDSAIAQESDKLKKAYLVMKSSELDASILLKNSGLIAKDFDDTLERLKFWLRKL